MDGQREERKQHKGALVEILLKLTAEDPKLPRVGLSSVKLRQRASSVFDYDNETDRKAYPYGYAMREIKSGLLSSMASSPVGDQLHCGHLKIRARQSRSVQSPVTMSCTLSKCLSSSQRLRSLPHRSRTVNYSWHLGFPIQRQISRSRDPTRQTGIFAQLSSAMT